MDRLVSEFERDATCVLLTLDCGFSILGPLEEKFPDRVINTGCREQATIAAAAGMVAGGLRVFVYGIASFTIFRGFEFIRLQLGNGGWPVKLIGYGCGNRFKHLGRSHTTHSDDMMMAELAGIHVYDADEFEEWIKDSNAAYLRVP